MSGLRLSGLLNNKYNGFTGSQGEIGFTGSRGDTGFVGSRGELGFTGSRGNAGFIGSRGDIGFTGSQGDIGFTGSRGVTSTPFIVTSNYTAADQDFIVADTTSNSFTITLPENPSTGSGIKIAAISASINNLTLNGNSNTFEDLESELVIDIDNVALEIIYSGTTWQVYVNVGPNGETGPQGEIGFTGSQGGIGFTGSQGVIGFTGSQGEIGFTGSIAEGTASVGKAIAMAIVFG